MNNGWLESIGLKSTEAENTRYKIIFIIYFL